MQKTDRVSPNFVMVLDELAQMSTKKGAEVLLDKEGKYIQKWSAASRKLFGSRWASHFDPAAAKAKIEETFTRVVTSPAYSEPSVRKIVADAEREFNQLIVNSNAQLPRPKQKMKSEIEIHAESTVPAIEETSALTFVAALTKLRVLSETDKDVNVIFDKAGKYMQKWGAVSRNVFRRRWIAQLDPKKAKEVFAPIFARVLNSPAAQETSVKTVAENAVRVFNKIVLRTNQQLPKLQQATVTEISIDIDSFKRAGTPVREDSAEVASTSSVTS